MQRLGILGIIFGIFLVLLLSGCSSELRGQDLDEIVIDDPCAEIVCGAQEVCSEGICGCDEGYKECNNQCIPEDGCCLDSACGVGETCEQNVCTFSCDNLQCESNKICSDDLQKCVCKAGYTWCELQNACIPEDHCCTKFDCGRDEKCVSTQIRAEICLEKGNDRHCNLLNDIEPKKFLVDGKKFEILLSDNFYAEFATLMINNDNFTMADTERKQVENAIVWLKELKEVGGNCKIFDSRLIGRKD